MVERLSSTQCKRLRGVAHRLGPLVAVGGRGVTDGVLAEVGAALQAHELIKVRFLDFKDRGRKRDAAALIARATGSHLVGLIGHVAIFYRAHPEAARRRIDPGPAT